ncbi:uncharacterized protein LOC132544188 [Ylistrum balloti]|uniref:uncharacterized protein LOC132544188 n=1 Tax=Ylistrum balloti TaxID=509963 RepID=UPI002905B383|nr:uncharacterized protein LOC132544188 [Ylistrum balloti]
MSQFSHIVDGLANMSQFSYIVDGLANMSQFSYIVDGLANMSQFSHIVEGLANMSQFSHIVDGLANMSQFSYIVEGLANMSQFSHIVDGLANMSQFSYIVESLATYIHVDIRKYIKPRVLVNVKTKMSLPLEAKKLHAELINELSGHLHPSLELEYDKFLNSLSVYLSPVERHKTASLFQVLENLTRKGKFGVGNYSVLKSLTTNPEILSVIHKFEQKIYEILHPDMSKSVNETDNPADRLQLTEQDLQRLAPCFGNGWQMFVGQLGVDSATVEQKQMENSTHVPSQVFHCLLVWYRRCPKEATITKFDHILHNSLDMCTINMDKYESLKKEIENGQR